MKAVLSRKYWNNQTTGKLVVFNEDHRVLDLVTIEQPDNGNQKNCSCIPEGHYECEKIESPRHGTCYLVKDVPDRSAILIHKGNYVTDTQGCILPGLYFQDLNHDGNTDVCDSTHAMEKLINVIGEKFELIII
jgi:hypothetical protein